MAEFNIAIQKTLQNEGGYSNDNLDNGGETKFGISRAAYPNLDIKNLTLHKAKIIYKRDYWDKLNLDAMGNQKIAEKLFDLAVNAGLKQAVKCLQRAIRSALGIVLIDDGIFGVRTHEALSISYNTVALLAAFRSEMAGFYRVLIAKNPSQERFKNGWITRAYS
jgi:lysozyme family protein